MASGLYNFQKAGNNRRKENKEKFIKEHYDELGFEKHYISPSEKDEIAKEYTINIDDLDELVDEANEEFIKTRKYIVLNDFGDVLKSNDFIDDELKEKLKKDYHQGGYDFYDEIKCGESIVEKNERYKSKILTEFESELDSYDFISDDAWDDLKSKFNDFNYPLIDETEFTVLIDEKNKSSKESNMGPIFDEFKKEMDSFEYITSEISDELKQKFNDFNYEYCDESEFYDLIKIKNDNSIDQQSNDFLNNLESTLNSCENIINQDKRLKLKSKYQKTYCDFYGMLDMDSIIDKHNEEIKPKIIKRVLNCEEGYISDSRVSELKSQYSDEIMHWDYIIEEYHESLDNDNASLRGSPYQFYPLNSYKSGLSRSSNFQIGLSKSKYKNGVYHLYNYVSTKKRYGYSQNEIKLSYNIWKYKDNHEYAIDFFTDELMDAVFDLSNDIIDENIEYVALVCVPPSKIFKNKNASMRKSIYRIKQYYDSNPEDCEKEIVDYSTLLYRCKDVPSYMERKISHDEHVDSIVCTKNDLSDENVAYILMDDVTTRGVIMSACKNILIEKGANPNNIYKLAIFATGDWR